MMNCSLTKCLILTRNSSRDELITDNDLILVVANGHVKYLAMFNIVSTCFIFIPCSISRVNLNPSSHTYEIPSFIDPLSDLLGDATHKLLWDATYTMNP